MTLKPFKWLFFLLFFGVSSAFAQANFESLVQVNLLDSDLPVQIDPDRVRNPFFWEVEYRGKKSYILGIHHIGISIDQLPDIVKEKLAESDTFIKETKTEDPITQLLVEVEGRLDEDTVIKDLIGKEAWNNLENTLTDGKSPHKIKEKYLKKFVPWRVMSYITVRAILENGFTGSLESELAQLATLYSKERTQKGAQGLQFKYLEQIGDTLKMLKEIVTPEALREVALDRDFLEKAKTETRALRESYIQGDLVDYASVHRSQHSEANFDRLITQRNNEWFPRLKDAFKDGAAFAVVGAGHLVDTDGIVELFRQDPNFKINRVVP